MDEVLDLDQLIGGVIDREGGYVDHSADKGGRTCFGITEAVARANGYAGAMDKLPRAFAADVYRRLYWSRPGLDKWRSAASASRRSCSTPASTWDRRSP